MIPKVIHYCWFGGKRKPKLIRDCIKSWELQLPDYEIIEWNEKNSDLTAPFTKEVYKLKKWAFVADYVRLKVLFDYGGIYLDTDMMVIKSFDVLLLHECFFGAEDKEHISAGIIGANKGSLFIKQCLLKYDFVSIHQEMNFFHIAMPKIISAVFRESRDFFLAFDNIIEKDGVVVYPFNYFYSLSDENKDDVKNYKKYLSPESFAVHLWCGSWTDYNEFHYFRNGYYRKGLTKMFQSLYIDKPYNYRYFRKILSSIKESLTKKVTKIND